MTDEPETCAVWYVRYGTSDYQLYADEERAASFAVYTDDIGEASVYGIQYRDGRVVRRENWLAYQAEKRRRVEAERVRSAEIASQPKRPMRQVFNPFNGKPVEVDIDEPDWLGRDPSLEVETK